MRHPRVRRPFIVESRGPSRDGNSVAIPKRASQASQPQQKPQGAARPLFDPWAAVTAPIPASATAERRILPNIMAPSEPAPAEPEPETLVEPPLPRVRRVKPRAVAAPRPAAPVVEAPKVATPKAATPKAAPAPEAPAPLSVAEPKRLVVAPRLSPRDERSARAALPAGQRWKARLPRACW